MCVVVGWLGSLTWLESSCLDPWAWWGCIPEVHWEMVNGLHLYSAFPTYGHSKHLTMSESNPLIHAFAHGSTMQGNRRLVRSNFGKGTAQKDHYTWLRLAGVSDQQSSSCQTAHSTSWVTVAPVIKARRYKPAISHTFPTVKPRTRDEPIVDSIDDRWILSTIDGFYRRSSQVADK